MSLTVQQHKEGVIISVRVQPSAKRSAIVGEHAGSLKVAIAAPPVDGKANAALVDFLAEALNLRRAQIEIVGGEASRQKRVLLRGISESIVRGLSTH